MIFMSMFLISFLFNFEMFDIICFIVLFFVQDGLTALHLAAAYGVKEIINILLEPGSNIHLQTKVLIFLFLFHFCFCLIVLM